MSTDDRIALALETSCSIGSVALGRGDGVLEERSLSGPRRHAAEFVALIARVCRDHGVVPDRIDAVAVSCGPGSFTGLRIGVTVARTLALACGTRILAVPTLEVIAQNAMSLAEPPQHVTVMLDAKRDRAYASSFRRASGIYVALDEPAEVSPSAYAAKCPPDTVVLGEGVERYATAVEAAGLSAAPSELHAPRATAVYRLGLGPDTVGREVPPREFVPRYIRPPEAEERWARRHGTS